MSLLVESHRKDRCGPRGGGEGYVREEKVVERVVERGVAQMYVSHKGRKSDLFLIRCCIHTCNIISFNLRYLYGGGQYIWLFQGCYLQHGILEVLLWRGGGGNKYNYMGYPRNITCNMVSLRYLQRKKELHPGILMPGVSFFLITASAIFMKNWAISDRDKLIFLPGWETRRREERGRNEKGG